MEEEGGGGRVPFSWALGLATGSTGEGMIGVGIARIGLGAKRLPKGSVFFELESSRTKL
jgi:hypothetical protein